MQNIALFVQWLLKYYSSVVVAFHLIFSTIQIFELYKYYPLVRDMLFWNLKQIARLSFSLSA